jgi:Tfp pilus assembly PilM family ATPase/Tfp pilus assembly protein PilN
MPAQTDPFLAILLSPKRTTLAEAFFIDSELHVSALGDTEPPAGAFDGHQLASGEILGRAISQFISQRQVSAREAVIVLPEASAITQFIKLPSMPHEDMVGAVRAVAERYAVFAEHAIAANCAVAEEFEEEGHQMANVLLSATRSANIDQCQECARAAGLELISIEAAPVTEANAFREQLAASEVVALAVVGEMKTDVMIFDSGVLRLCYSANAGIPEQTEDGDWMSPAPEGYDPFSPPPQLYSELSHCFRFYQNQFPQKAVQRLLVAVDHPQAELVVSHLAEQLQLPVELARPGAELNLPAQVDQDSAARSRALSLGLIKGAAVSALRASNLLFSVSLLPATAAMWRPVRPYVKLTLAAMAVLLVASLLYGWALKNKVEGQEQRLASVNGEIARLQPEIEALRAAQASELALRNEVERHAARIARERAVRWSQIMVDVAERLPEDMWLTRIASPDSSKIALNGIATNRETIPRAIESLSGSPYLENVVLGSLNKDDSYAPGGVVIRYQINARLLRGLLPPGARMPAESDAQEVVS